MMSAVERTLGMVGVIIKPDRRELGVGFDLLRVLWEVVVYGTRVVEFVEVEGCNRGKLADS
jgi:hypothetical protein